MRSTPLTFVLGSVVFAALIVACGNSASGDRSKGTPSAAPEGAEISSSDTALKAPVAAGQGLWIIHGYNDPPPGDACVIPGELDHCNNQQYALDLEPENQDDKRILAPLSGVVEWIRGDCLGIRTVDDLNLTVCHFDGVAVLEHQEVTQGDLLGTREESWIHLSLDDRYNHPDKPYPPVAFNGRHTFEGQSLDPDGSRNQWQGYTLGSTDEQEWKTFRSIHHPYQVAVPPDWTVGSLQMASTKADAFRGKIEQGYSSSFQTNVNIFSEPINDWVTLQDYVDNCVALTRQILPNAINVKEIRSEMALEEQGMSLHDGSGSIGRLISAEWGEDAFVQQVIDLSEIRVAGQNTEVIAAGWSGQYSFSALFLHEQRAWQVTLSFGDGIDDFSGTVREFERMLRSFQFID